jgi:hypothetical protein
MRAQNTKRKQARAMLQSWIAEDAAMAYLIESLKLIADRKATCLNFFDGVSCRNTSRTRSARRMNNRWCACCIAREALERVASHER